MREKEKIKQNAQQACWIINYTSQVLKKGSRGIKVKDLVKFTEDEKPTRSVKDSKKMMYDAFAFAQTKFWMKVKGDFGNK